MSAAHPEFGQSFPPKVDQMLTLLKQYLPLIGQAEAVNDISVEPVNAAAWDIALVKLGMGFIVGAPVKQGAGIIVPGYAVYAVTIYGGSRDEPPEQDIDEFGHVLSPQEALATLGSVWAIDMANNVWMNQMPEEE